MNLLLRAYPREWRERYGDELIALLEAEPLTWRARANVVAAGLDERLRGSGPAPVRVLWAWAIFVVGGMAFQKTSEQWQAVVPHADRGIPTAAFDTVQAAAILGTAAVLAGVALALPAFLRDLRGGGWTALRRPILIASVAAIVAAGALGAVAISHGIVAGAVFVWFALFSLFAWTHAAAVAARRVPQRRLHTHLAYVVSATMLIMTAAAAVWFGSLMHHAPSFVGATQLGVVATFMLAGSTLAIGAASASIRP